MCPRPHVTKEYEVDQRFTKLTESNYSRPPNTKSMETGDSINYGSSVKN